MKPHIVVSAEIMHSKDSSHNKINEAQCNEVKRGLRLMIKNIYCDTFRALSQE